MARGRSIQPLRAMRAMRKLLANPNDTRQVFVIIDSLSGNTLGRLLKRFRHTAHGAEVLREQRQLLPALVDHERLLALPEGSLGRVYAEFCRREQITADGLVKASEEGAREAGGDWLDPDRVLLGRRLRDMHDLWHVVTGYETDLVGEAALLAFTVPQTRNPGVAFIVGTVFLRARGEGRFMRKVMTDALLRGARARWLVAADWESLLPLPLDEVRSTLKVGPPVKYFQVRFPRPQATPAAAAATAAA